MAVEIITKRWDDLHLKEDGPDEKVEAVETLTFDYQGTTFEIDLSEDHLTGYHSYMERLANAARIPHTPKAAKGKVGSPRGLASPYADYNRNLREWFASIGEPIKSYPKKGKPDKKAGYKYKRDHWRRYNAHLRETGRENEVMHSEY